MKTAEVTIIVKSKDAASSRELRQAAVETLNNFAQAEWRITEYGKPGPEKYEIRLALAK